MMEIKKLEKKDVKEGLSLEFVNSVSLNKRHSPVMFDFKDEPVKTLRCSGGFWVSVGFGEFLKDKTDNLIVFSEREVHIARARYLFKHPEIDEPLIKGEKKEFPTPMFVAHYDNPEEMDILKKVFSKDALEKADFNPDKIKENLAIEQLKQIINKDS